MHNVPKLYVFLVRLFAAALLTASCFAQTPLVTVDWSTPRYFTRPAEHLTYQGVNLYTRSLDGYEEDLGAVGLAYDESVPGISNELGNFRLKSLGFYNGVALELPRVELTLGLWGLRQGNRLFTLTSIFDEPEPAGGQRTGFSMPKHGRYLFIKRTNNQHSLDDTATGVRYMLERAITGGTEYYQPISAELPDGWVVSFQYDTSLWTQLKSATLWRETISLETIDLQYVLGRVDRVLSSKDPARHLGFTYHTWGGLKDVSLGGGLTTSTAVSGLKFTYIATGSGPTQKYALWWVTNLANRELIKYQLSDITTPNGTRKAYTGVRVGPASIGGGNIAFTTFQYPQANKAIVTSPREPGNPSTFTLEPTRGLAIKLEKPNCPNPLEEIEFYPVGNPHEGLLYKEHVRERCDKLIHRTYTYSTNGDLVEVATDAGGEISSNKFVYTIVSLTNSQKTKELTKAENPLGAYTAWNYDVNSGRLQNVEADSGAIQTNFEYEYQNQATGKAVSKITTTSPNTRRDKIQFNTDGRIALLETNIDSAEKLTSSISYDQAHGRARSTTDPKGNVSSIQYRDDTAGVTGDSRVKSSTLTAVTQPESISTTYTPTTDFPELAAAITRQHTIGANSKTTTTNYNYYPSTPYLNTITLSGSTLSTPATLSKATLDPITLNTTKTCGYSSDGSDQSCTEYFYKTSGVLSGQLDRVDIRGGSANGGVTETPSYNTSFEPTGSTVADALHSVSTAYEFDHYGRVSAKVTNPNESTYQQRQEYNYDLGGKLSKAKQYEAGKLIGDTTYAYDDQGKSERLLEVIDAVSGYKTRLQYNDPAKRMTKYEILSPGGQVKSSLVAGGGYYTLYDQLTDIDIFEDGRGWFMIDHQANKYGEIISTLDNFNNTTTLTRDAFGRLKTSANTLQNQTFAYGFETDGKSLMTSTTQLLSTPSGTNFTLTSNIKRNALGLVVEQNQTESGNKTTFTYNTRGLPTVQVNTYQNNAGFEIWNYAYDTMDRVNQLKHAGQIVWEKTFSGLGLLSTVKDSRLNPTTFNYDKLLRLLKTTYPDQSFSEITRYEYNPNTPSAFLTIEGNLRGGDTALYEIDRQGRPTREMIQGDQSFGAMTRTYAYDSASDRLLEIRAIQGQTVGILTYTHDIGGRLASETTKIQSPLDSYEFKLQSTYQSQGLVASQTYPNGAVVLYQRDNWGRIDQIKLNNQLKADYQYSGALLDNVIQGPITRTFNYNGAKPIPLIYGYSDTVNGTPVATLTYTYDQFYRLSSRQDTGARGAEEILSYSNHHMLSSYTLDSHHLTGPITTNYDPKLDGILDSIQDVDADFRLPSKFTYDPRGNPLAETSANGLQYSWKPLGISTVYDPGQILSGSFTQDPLGRNIYLGVTDEVLNTQKNFYLRHNGMLLWERKE